jgi:hypothetical protein
MAKNPFVNRIIGYDTKPADQFQANPANWRKHPQRQRDAVNGSLRELGWIAAVVENVRTGHLVDGHERVWQALANNEDVPYLQVDLSEDEERLALAIFDPITYMAETDAAQLDALLKEVNTTDAALQALLEETARKAGLYGVDDPMAEWKGMPEFENESIVHKTITIYFASQADVDAFAALIDQTITPKTTFAWYPKQEHENLKAYIAHES